jgi:hypothetical protein
MCITDLEKQQQIIQYDDDGNAMMVFEGDVHIVTNGDFVVTANGEVSMLSRSAISLDCALLMLNCRLSKQLREMKHELRLQFIDMMGGMPNLTDEQKSYLKITKNKAVEILSLDSKDVSHLEE